MCSLTKELRTSLNRKRASHYAMQFPRESVEFANIQYGSHCNGDILHGEVIGQMAVSGNEWPLIQFTEMDGNC